MPPSVDVITPTWARHDLLLGRCIPSVQAQDYPDIRHVVVSDGPDPELRDKLAGLDVRFEELPEHDPHAQWGHHARLHGIDLAKGDYIAYLDDDNSWRPDHVRLLVKALQETGAGFAYSKVAMHGRGEYVVGTDPPECGGIDTSIIMHRRDLLDAGITWRWFPGIPTIDWDLAERWMAIGATWVHVPEITADYYFQ